MWRDRDPYPEHNYVPDTFWLLVAVLLFAACGLVWLLIWRTRLGYEIRAFGKSERAARYAGISPARITVVAMLISGGLAGLMAINHPLGILLAALLFGFLYQGGGELALFTQIPRELIVVIQALVILFTGALDNMVRMLIAPLFARRGGA